MPRVLKAEGTSPEALEGRRRADTINAPRVMGLSHILRLLPPGQAEYLLSLGERIEVIERARISCEDDQPT
jgi:hypothetical protein